MSSSNRLQRRRSPPPITTSETGNNIPPATNISPAAAAQTVTPQAGEYPTQTPVLGSPTQQDGQRALKRQPTADSIANPSHASVPVPEEKFRQQSQQPHGHGPPGSFPPQSSRAMEGSYVNPNEGLAYGHDHRSKPPKERSGGGASSTFKKLGHALFSEAVQQSRPVATMETDMDRYQRERQDLRRQCRDLQEQNNYNLIIIKQLQDELIKEKDRADRSKRSANLLETTMENKEIFLGVQAQNDDEIRSRFGSLMSSIKTWSNNFNAGSGHVFKEELLPEYQRVAPLCTKLSYLERLVDDKKRKRLFVRGWAAYVMTKLLFRTLGPSGGSSRDVWMHRGLSEPFSRLENELWIADRKLITHRAFNDWRAFTADLLGKASVIHAQESREEIRQAVLNAVHDVMALVRPWCVSEDHDTSYADRLQKIFIEAIQLAQFLRSQRALWSVRFPSRQRLPGLEELGHLMFDPSSMKDDRGDYEDIAPEKLKHQYIDIVVTPALYKRGNTNGERFENEEACLPAIVVMKLG